MEPVKREAYSIVMLDLQTFINANLSDALVSDLQYNIGSFSMSGEDVDAFMEKLDLVAPTRHYERLLSNGKTQGYDEIVDLKFERTLRDMYEEYGRDFIVKRLSITIFEANLCEVEVETDESQDCFTYSGRFIIAWK